MQNLCDNGASIASGQMLDGTHRMHYQGMDVNRCALIGGLPTTAFAGVVVLYQDPPARLVAGGVAAGLRGADRLGLRGQRRPGRAR